MSLRRKLTITFGALALLGFTVAGVSVWATLQWDRTNKELRRHYARSLLAQEIRATTFEAFKEIPDSLGENDPDARQEFEEILRPVDEDFERWRELADTGEERRQVREVRAAYDGLVRDARRFFDLLESGNREAAAELADTRIEEGDFESFQAATREAVESDRDVRDEVRAGTEDARQTARLVLVVASFGTVSLLLLLGAYLASDIFGPLRELEGALAGVEKGDLGRRLDAERADEIGAVNRAFNRMAGAVALRERAALDGPEDGGSAWGQTPSRVTLHRLVSRLRSRIALLGDGVATGAEQRELARELDRLSQAVARLAEFGFPLDLSLARADVRELVYDVAIRFREELVARGVSLDLELHPEVNHAVLDRLKLREALCELVRNALHALPERGGRVGLRARTEGGELLLEVADDGAGADQGLIDAAFDPEDPGADGRPRTGLALTGAIIEQHGGDLEVRSRPGEGTHARIRLPLLD